MRAARKKMEPIDAGDESSAVGKPFLKWVGGKRQLLPAIVSRMPERIEGTYYEPFVGGGALFFHLRPKRAALSDVNTRLVRAYRGVRDDVDGVLALLETYPNERDFFLEFRTRDIDAAKSDAEVAAWLIYLNKTGFNGLYRVNSKNRYNVPFGRYKSPNYRDEPRLRACAKALAGVEVGVRPFDEAVRGAKKGDFVYFDPPYVPLSATSDFTSYTSDGFTMDDQRRLRDVALELKSRGVFVMLSNSSADAVRSLYRGGFELHEVSASRMVNSDGGGRGRITELLIT